MFPRQRGGKRRGNGNVIKLRIKQNLFRPVITSEFTCLLASRLFEIRISSSITSTPI